MLKFAPQLVKYGQVILAGARHRPKATWACSPRAAKCKRVHTLPPQLAFNHRLPVTHEPLVARTLRPDVFKAFGLRLKPEQLGLVVGIGKVLDLQPLIFVKRCEQQAKLFLKFIQVGDGTVGKVGRFKDKTFGDVTAAPERIEQNQIVHEKSIGCAFKHIHMRWDLPTSRCCLVHHLLNVDQIIYQLFHGAGAVDFIDGDLGFLNMRQRPIHVRAGGAAEAVRLKAGRNAASAAVSWPSSACR